MINAFPQNHPVDYSRPASNINPFDPGMSLRDYFARAAMQALVQPVDSAKTFPGIATRAYQIADAMIEARDPKPVVEEPAVEESTINTVNDAEIPQEKPAKGTKK